MTYPGRLMGLDVGERTIGVAVSDPLGLTAQPRTTLRRTSTAADVERLVGMARKEGVEAFVVGLPLRTTGKEGPEAVKVRLFAARLADYGSQPVHFVDERFTTAVAQAVLLEAGVSRRERRASVDNMAAALILQGYLDRRRSEEV